MTDQRLNCIATTALLTIACSANLSSAQESNLQLVNDWSSISALTQLVRTEDWKPRTNMDRLRGGEAASVYPKIAPATVVVRTDTGHGTGFLVDADGWIVTNHHVIADAVIDPETVTQRVQIHLGRLADNGFMRVNDKGIEAVVYKSSEGKDLALLKLVGRREDAERLPTIQLAANPPLAGSPCVVIGHPAAGMLWTVREGVVSGVGSWPSDMIDVVMQRLAVVGRDRERIDRICKEAPQRQVLISSCGLNPGDSGGPIVNERAELIGVSFAIPSSDQRNGVDLAKFSYHVHLDEVRAFLQDKPEAPAIYIPTAWPAGLYSALADIDDDGRPDAMVFMADKQGSPAGIVFDLDQDSQLGLKRGAIGEVNKEDWDFEFALHHLPAPRAFYDTDNDAEIDLVLIDGDNDGETDRELRLDEGIWKVAAPNEQISDRPEAFHRPRTFQTSQRIGDGSAQTIV